MCTRPSPSLPEAGSSGPFTVVEVAITVDDLPSHGPEFPGIDRRAIANAMLTSLARHRVPSVYGFVNGKTERTVPGSKAVLEDWVAAGHPLGNHSWSHQSLNDLTAEDYVGDIVRGEAILQELALSEDWHLFRYPFLQEGDTLSKQASVRRSLKKRGYRIAPVSVDGSDWAYNRAFARCKERDDDHGISVLRRDLVAEQVRELRRMRKLTRMLMGREVRHVLLLHVGAASADAMESLLAAFEKEGVRWIDLPTALEDPFYEQDFGGPYRGGAAFPYRVAQVREVDGFTPTFGEDVKDRISSVCR